MVPQLVTRIGNRVCRDYIEYSIQKDENGNIMPSDQFHFSINGGNNTLIKYNDEIPAYKALKDYLSGNFVMTAVDPLCHSSFIFTDKNDAAASFKMNSK